MTALTPVGTMLAPRASSAWTSWPGRPERSRERSGRRHAQCDRLERSGERCSRRCRSGR